MHKLKKIKISLIAILSILLIAIISFNIYIRCANRMPYVFANHTISVQYNKITYPYTKSQIKQKLEDLTNVDEIVHNVHNQIFGEYPIFDEEYREVLNCKILKHYYTDVDLV